MFEIKKENAYLVSRSAWQVILGAYENLMPGLLINEFVRESWLIQNYFISPSCLFYIPGKRLCRKVMSYRNACCLELLH